MGNKHNISTNNYGTFTHMNSSKGKWLILMLRKSTWTQPKNNGWF